MFRSKRVPVVLQMSAADCGAACLSMIVGYWGGRLSRAACQEAVGGGQNGVTALMIAQAARQLGLTVEAFRHSAQGLAQAQLPAIVHWHGVHFVVLEKWTANRVTIVDPALGRRTLTPEQFAAGYSGVTLTFAPGPDFAERMAEESQAAPPFTWRTFARRVWAVPGARGLMAQLLAASLLLQAAGLVLPFATWLVVEVLLPDANARNLALLGGGLAAAALAQSALGYARDLLTLRLQQRLDSALIPDFFTHLLRLPYSFFQQRTSGDLLARLEGNGALRELVAAGVLTGLLDGGLALLYLLVLYAQWPLFGLVVTGVALAQFGLLIRTGERVYELSQMELALQAEEQSLAVQSLRGIESVKAAGATAWIGGEWRKRFGASLDASLSRGRYVARLNGLLGLLSSATPLLLLWLGVGAVATGSLSLGQMLALVVLASSALAPLGSLADRISQGQRIWAYLERLGDVLATQPEEAAEPTNSAPLVGGISVSHLSFRYARGDAFGLHDISFAIEPGEQVAIVGPTGVGKSTLVRLLLGLYSASEGVICYDGRPLEEIGLTNLRGEIGVVMQDSFLLSGSIRENIALHQPGMELAAVVRAARLAAIHDEIERLPMGYETRVGEGGSGLSGGQRQRIVLARALATRPKVLILDEATSHLDPTTEAEIQRNLDGLATTRLIVAHRLSTVRHADRVLVLEQGRLVASGAHHVLAGMDGLYARLLREQYAEPI